MLAAEAKQVNVGEMLIAQFPRCVPWTNKMGMDAVCFIVLYIPIQVCLYTYSS